MSQAAHQEPHHLSAQNGEVKKEEYSLPWKTKANSTNASLFFPPFLYNPNIFKRSFHPYVSMDVCVSMYVTMR